MYYQLFIIPRTAIPSKASLQLHLYTEYIVGEWVVLKSDPTAVKLNYFQHIQFKLTNEQLGFDKIEENEIQDLIDFASVKIQ